MLLSEFWTFVLRPVLTGVAALLVVGGVVFVFSYLIVKVEKLLSGKIQVPLWLDLLVKGIILLCLAWAIGMVIWEP
jgi:hypothetical protein